MEKLKWKPLILWQTYSSNSLPLKEDKKLKKVTIHKSIGCLVKVKVIKKIHQLEKVIEKKIQYVYISPPI